MSFVLLKYQFFQKLKFLEKSIVQYSIRIWFDKMSHTRVVSL